MPLFKASIFTFLFLFSSLLYAEKIQYNIFPDTPVNAKFHLGEKDKNPVIIIHGFLQTHDYSTTSRIHESLIENGYTVLSPSLSYGIKDRRQSVKCEALHLHNLEGDVAELANWIKWLKEKNPLPPILIGHSAGGKVISRYINTHLQSPIDQSILISLTYLPKTKVIKHLATLNRGLNDINNYSIDFCKNYPTTYKNYLSYANWNPEELLKAGENINHPLSIILGTDDKRAAPHWRQTLENSSLNLINIEGANHFYDNESEFDLIDAIDTLLEKEH